MENNDKDTDSEQTVSKELVVQKQQEDPPINHCSRCGTKDLRTKTQMYAHLRQKHKVLNVQRGGYLDVYSIECTGQDCEFCRGLKIPQDNELQQQMQTMANPSKRARNQLQPYNQLAVQRYGGARMGAPSMGIQQQFEQDGVAAAMEMYDYQFQHAEEEAHRAIQIRLAYDQEKLSNQMVNQLNDGYEMWINRQQFCREYGDFYAQQLIALRQNTNQGIQRWKSNVEKATELNKTSGVQVPQGKPFEQMHQIVSKYKESTQKTKEAMQFNDVADFKERMQTMGMRREDTENLADIAKEVQQQMTCLQYGLNQNQLGVTMYALKEFEAGTQRQIFAIPAGQGKSRVILGIISALNNQLRSIGQAKKIKQRKYMVLYNHQLQLNDDREKLEQIKLADDCDVEYMVPNHDHSFNFTKNTVFIIDEVDAVLLDRTIGFSRGITNSIPLQVFGLTATARDEFEELESDHIQKLGFKITDSHIQGNCVDVEKLDRISWQDYFGIYKGMAFLVYLNDADLDEVERIAKEILGDIQVRRNFRENLSQMRKMQSNEVFLATQPDLMRGFDYGSEKGIALMIAKPLGSNRDLKQALGRVNRYSYNEDLIFLHEDLQETVDRKNVGVLARSVRKSWENNIRLIKSIQNIKKSQPIALPAIPDAAGTGGAAVEERKE